jgi:hypothetical protein
MHVAQRPKVSTGEAGTYTDSQCSYKVSVNCEQKRSTLSRFDMQLAQPQAARPTQTPGYATDRSP